MSCLFLSKQRGLQVRGWALQKVVVGLRPGLSISLSVLILFFLQLGGKSYLQALQKRPF